MKKKIAISIVSAVLAFSFTGCGKTSEPSQVAEMTTQVESSTPTKESTETTPKTEAPSVPKEISSSEATPEPTTAPTAVPTVEPTPVPTEEPKDAYTYTDMSATMYAKSSVNVRDLPSTDGSKVGSLNTNSEVAVTGKCNETGWYRFVMNGQDAYVSGNYLQSSKVQVATQAGSQSTNGGAPATQQGGSQQAGSAPSGATSADAGSADGASENGGNGSQGSSSDVSWELITDVEGGKIYQGSDGSQMSVSDSGVVDVTPAENIGNGQTDLPPEMTDEDWELVHQLEDLINQQNGGN